MHVISASELMGPGWRFLADVAEGSEVGWSTVSGQPRNHLTRARSVAVVLVVSAAVSLA